MILRISPYLLGMRENADLKNSEYGHFSGSAKLDAYTFDKEALLLACS